jgi:GT2 family glycosyltransferase
MKILYTKYNRERLPQFQTETIIYSESGMLHARKRALTPEANIHIESISENYNKLKSTMNNVSIAKSELNGDSISFEYIDYPTLDILLFQAMLDKDKELFFHYLSEYKKMIFLQPLSYEERFIPSSLFGNVFGLNIDISQVQCQGVANIDLTFDNITYDNGQFTVIDYEWVFDFDIPIDFVVFRSINEFSAKYAEYLKHFIDVKEIYNFFNVKNEHIATFYEMESTFQAYVFGMSRNYSDTSKVQKGITRYDDLLAINVDYQKKSNELDSLKHRINDKENEVINLTAEHERLISEMSDKVSDLLLEQERLASEIDEMNSRFSDDKTALTNMLINKDVHISGLLERERTLENIYQSSGWRLLTKYYKFRDLLIPANSKRRIFSKLAVKAMKNPKLMLSKLNKADMKKLKYYLNSEDAKLLESRIDSYVERNTVQSSPRNDIEIFLNKEYGKLRFDAYDNPIVSIIIPVYNQWDYTYSCLASILQNTGDIPYEIIIADDMSSDKTVDINDYIENITVIRDGENRGFLLNCNHAAGYAKGKYIFFLNNDTNVQPAWLSTLVQLIESDSNIGMVGSKLIFPDGKQQEAGGIIWNDASGWNFGRLDDPEKAEYNYVKEVDYISGAAILVRHDLWRQLGGFDERYVPAYFEDSDLAFEIRRLGYKVLLQPQSVIVHFEGISHGTDTGSGVKSYQIKNKEKFLDKWQTVLQRDNYSNAEHVFWARDRSGKKKTIVIVDHYVPHYDKDAGGRCTYFYIKLMVSMGLHVIFIGDNFFRHEPYTSELQQLGVEVLYGNEYAKGINQWIKSNGQYIDYVYLNRPHISIKYMDVFKKFTKAKIIYFGHDLHYLREMRNYELTKNPSVLKSAEEWKETEFKLFNQADVIHVVGTYEQKVIEGNFPNKPIRNIPLYTYDNGYSDDHIIPMSEERRDLLFVGGFNHKPNYDGIMWFIENILPAIKEAMPDIKLYIVGSNPPEDLKSQQSQDLIITGYVSDEELEKYYNQCRIVVVPLRFGAGVKGKIVEAMYYQVPVVTTSIGAEGLEDIEAVLTVADQESEFARSVIELYTNTDKWSLYSQSSGEYIEQYFTLEAARNILSLDIEC